MASATTKSQKVSIVYTEKLESLPTSFFELSSGSDGSDLQKTGELRCKTPYQTPEKNAIGEAQPSPSESISEPVQNNCDSLIETEGNDAIPVYNCGESVFFKSQELLELSKAIEKRNRTITKESCKEDGGKELNKIETQKLLSLFMRWMIANPKEFLNHMEDAEKTLVNLRKLNIEVEELHSCLETTFVSMGHLKCFDFFKQILKKKGSLKEFIKLMDIKTCQALRGKLVEERRLKVLKKEVEEGFIDECNNTMPPRVSMQMQVSSEEEEELVVLEVKEVVGEVVMGSVSVNFLADEKSIMFSGISKGNGRVISNCTLSEESHFWYKELESNLPFHFNVSF